jgi:hypothetical protein
MARRTALFGIVLGVGTIAVPSSPTLAQTPTTDAAAVEAKALAVGAGDLNGDGVTNGVDLDILIDNLGIAADALATQGDLDLDKDVDNDDLAEMLSLVTATFDINARTVIERLMEKGLIELKDAYAQHPHHNTPFSGAGHQREWSASHPNHELTVSRDWGNPGLQNPPPHSISHSGQWPPNHPIIASSTWVHATNFSGTWPARHNRLWSQVWPSEHLQPTSRRWPPTHQPDFSSATVPEPPEDHNQSFSGGWEPDHALATSHQQWPPNHVVSISTGWNPRPASHSVAQSRQWPPNHFTEVSIGWPNPDNNWPPNHFKTITEGPTLPPAGQ